MQYKVVKFIIFYFKTLIISVIKFQENFLTVLIRQLERENVTSK